MTKQDIIKNNKENTKLKKQQRKQLQTETQPRPSIRKSNHAEHGSQRPQEKNISAMTACIPGAASPHKHATGSQQSRGEIWASELPQ